MDTERAAHAPADAAVAQPGDTLIRQLAENAEHHGSAIALRERDHGIWQEWSWRDYLDSVLAFAAGLESLGFGPGAALTVVGDNRANLYFGALAAVALRGFPSPVFPDVPPEELRHYSRLAEPRFALAEDQEQVDKLLELRERTGQPATILYDDPRGLARYAAPGLVSCAEVMTSGRERLRAEPGLAADLLGRAQPDDIVVLLHSSGTTGLPKGIPLRHRQICGAVRNAAAGGYFAPGEQHYAYLPMAWVGDFVFTLGAGIALRFTTNIPERQETVLRNLREVAPTMYLAAPRSWDTMLTTVQVAMAESTRLKRRLFDFFVPLAVAMERERLAGRTPSAGKRLLRLLGEVLVYGPIKDFLGLSRTRRAYTGGEAIGEDTFVFFRALGVPLKQFYGQTETCALSAAQQDGTVKLHTVGHAMPGVDIRIAENGEILIRSVGVFDGYFNDSASTAKALEDGWLRTGDAGYREDDGSIVVLGRVSEVVYTAKGERFIPNYVENRLKFSPYIRNVAVLGAGRDWLGAIVCIDMEATGHWAQLNNVAYTSYADLSQKPEVQELVAGAIRHVNTMLPEGLRIRRFVNLHKDFDADDGEITRTRKLRRNVIEEHYGALIDAIYRGAGDVEFAARITYESGGTGTLTRHLTVREVG